MIYPKEYPAIEEDTRLANFNMASDLLTCSLLKTLAASKPKSRFLELRTDTGLSTSWILAGMDTLFFRRCPEARLTMQKYICENRGITRLLHL